MHSTLESTKEFERIRELASMENLKDLFAYIPLNKVYGKKEDVELQKEVEEMLSVFSGKFGGPLAESARICSKFGVYPWVDKHEILKKFAFNGEQEGGNFVFKTLPKWWNNKFPKDSSQICKIIHEIVDYETFDSGVIPQKVWKTARELLPSPMDRKVLTKPKLGNILKAMADGGMISVEIVTKFNQRVKSKDMKFLVNCSGNPQEFSRLSSSPRWSSCVGPGGSYAKTLFGLTCNPTKIVFYIDEPKEYSSDPLSSTHCRIILHLAADYKFSSYAINSYASFFSHVKSYVNNGKKSALEVLKTLKVKTKWYIVCDRYYDDGTQTYLPAALFMLHKRANELGMSLAAPSNWNAFQSGGATANMTLGDGTTLYTPIVSIQGIANYSDNLSDNFLDTSLGNICVSAPFAALKPSTREHPRLSGHLYVQSVKAVEMSMSEEQQKRIFGKKIG